MADALNRSLANPGDTRRYVLKKLASVGLLAPAGGLLLPKSAAANTLFTLYGFPATGTTTPRNMPDRLAEIKNVLDFGADPTGVADSQPAVQAAVDANAGANRGTIYFPLGSYKFNSPVTYNYDGNLSIIFRGEGLGSRVAGNFSGYIFDRHLATPNNTTGVRGFEKMQITNSNANGGGIRMGSTIGGFIRDCSFGCFQNITTEDSVGNSSQQIFIQDAVFAGNGTVSGSSHIIIGGGGVIEGCYITGADTGVIAYGSGLHVAGNRLERNNTAWKLGVDSAGNDVGLTGFSILACTSEGSWTTMDFAGTCSGFYVGSYYMLGHTASNAGVTPNIQNTQYGVRIRADKANSGVFMGLNLGSVADVGGFSFENATSRANLLLLNVLSTVTVGVPWVPPTNAYTALFQGCNISPVFTAAGLPSGGNALEGDEYNISDSNTATWGATVAGGGSNRILARYNGTNFTVVGI